MRFCDYVYRDRDDRTRLRIFRRDTTHGGRWDYDVFRRGMVEGGWSVETFSERAGDNFRTRAEAIDEAEGCWGDLTPIKVGAVTEGWPARAPAKKTRDAHVAIEVGQVWRLGTRRLRVLSYSRHWNAGRAGLAADAMQVVCRFTDPSGREVGTMIRGRLSAEVTYSERRFREKFRHVARETP